METAKVARLWAILALCVALGLIARLAFVSTMPSAAPVSDEVDYIESARDILANRSFDATVYYHVPPVVPILYAGLFLFAEPGLAAVRVFHCFLFLLLAPVAYLLGKEIGGRITGIACLAMVAAYPYFIYFTGYAVTETVATIVIPGTLLLAVYSARWFSGGFCLAFGASLAVASLTRAAALYFVLAIPLIYAIAWGLKGTAWIKATGLALAAFLALYSPWCFVNYLHFGEFVPTPTIGSGVMLYQTALRITMPDDAARWSYLKKEILPKYYYPPGANDRDRLEGDKYLAREGKRIIGENLNRYPSVLWKNFKRFWQFYPKYEAEGGRGKAVLYKALGLGTYGLLFPFMVAGALGCMNRFRQLSALYGFVVYFTLVHVIVYGKLRYRIPMDPLLLAFASFGAVWLCARVSPKWEERCERWLDGPVRPVHRREA